MLEDLTKESEQKMQKALEVLRREFASLRAGRANPALLERVMVDYYGTPTPINQVGNIGVPEPRLLVVQPWDKSLIPAVEKAILKSDLGVTPSSDGNVVRIAIPQLTQERRKELAKVIKKKAEESRVAVRNIRRDANDRLKAMEKKGEISEDESRRQQDALQKLTDNFIKLIDKTAEAKEHEIMEV
ncbi:MAG: ribosome recycling factor [Syntrophomonadaceae bacterium]|jgi:ribosome recycling factor|nr:ribosome recycling factor [Syntrophomonadaceae bacterium]